MVNWDNIINVVGSCTLKKFATGDVSGRQIESLARFTPAATDVRKIIRPVDRGREIARKALKRRGHDITCR